MAVKAVEEIPGKARPNTIVGQIRRDIQEAFVHGIDMYELVGEIYEGRQVAQPAKTEAWRFYRSIIRNRVEPYLERPEFASYVQSDGCFKVYTHKAEDGKTHVYVEVFRDVLEERVKFYIKDINEKHPNKRNPRPNYEITDDVKEVIDSYMKENKA